MEANILQTVLEYIVNQESKKIVGKACKRFEVLIQNKQEEGKTSITIEELNLLKKEIKELLYEFCRDLRDIVNTGKIAIKLESEKSKEK
jgi:hypothetical protein